MYVMNASRPLKVSALNRPTPSGMSCRVLGLYLAAHCGTPPTDTHVSVLLSHAEAPPSATHAPPLAAIRHEGPLPGSAQTLLHWKHAGAGRLWQSSVLNVQSAGPGVGLVAFAKRSAVMNAFGPVGTGAGQVVASN